MIRLIWSQDDLLAEEAVEDAVAAAPQGAEHVTIDADVGIGGLEEAIFAGSLFAKDRLVVLRNAQVLKKADVERVSELLHHDPVPSDVVVSAVSDRMPSALIESLKTVAKTDRLSRPRRGELVNWVNKRLQRSGVAATPQVGPALVEALGESLRDIAQAIDQLALRAGKGGRIEPKDVAQHFRPRSEQPFWVLFDSLVKHDGMKAFEDLRRLLEHDDALPILGSLISQVRGIIRTKSLVERDRSISDRDVARELGPPMTEARVAVMRRQSSRLSWEWLLQVHRLLANADFELKGGEDGAVLPPEMVMERVVAGALEAG